MVDVEQGFAVIDTETTGFTARDQVLQVAVVFVDPDLTISGEWDTYINPGLNFIPGYQVHRITSHTVAFAPRFRDVAPVLLRKLAGRTVVAHNLPFDRRMLNQEFTRAGQPLLGDGVCTWEMARRLLPKPHHNRLAPLCHRLGVNLEGAHDARADARAAAEVFIRLTQLERDQQGREQGPGLPVGRWLRQLATSTS